MRTVSFEEPKSASLSKTASLSSTGRQSSVGGGSSKAGSVTGSVTSGVTGVTTILRLGLSGQGLKDKDFIGKSDPYYVISRPDDRGGHRAVVQSETKNNNLNPDWKSVFVSEGELCGFDRNVQLRLEDFFVIFNSS